MSGPEKAWHEQSLLTFIRPIVFVQIADKKEGRLLFCQDVVTPSTHAGQQIHIAFSGASILWAITEIIIRLRFIIVDCGNADVAFLVRRGERFERRFDPYT